MNDPVHACLLSNEQLAYNRYFGSGDGAVVRAFASHHCGLGSIPGLGVMCGLSLLLVLVPALRVFSGYSGFPPSKKTNSTWKQRIEEPLCGIH